MSLQTLQCSEGGFAGDAGELLPTGLLVEVQVAQGPKLGWTAKAGQSLGRMHLLVVLLQKLERLEVSLLLRLCYVVLALHHWAEKGRGQGSRRWGSFKEYVLTN